MSYSVNKIYSKYQGDKKTFFVEIEPYVSIGDEHKKISIIYTLEFDDLEVFNINKKSINHYRSFVFPLIQEKFIEEYSQIKELLQQQLDNGQ